MAKWVPSIMQKEKDAIWKKEQATKSMTDALHAFRESAVELRSAGKAVMEIFGFIRRNDLSDTRQLAEIEKRIVFKNESTKPPAALDQDNAESDQIRESATTANGADYVVVYQQHEHPENTW